MYTEDIELKSITCTLELEVSDLALAVTANTRFIDYNSARKMGFLLFQYCDAYSA